MELRRGGLFLHSTSLSIEHPLPAAAPASSSLRLDAGTVWVCVHSPPPAAFDELCGPSNTPHALTSTEPDERVPNRVPVAFERLVKTHEHVREDLTRVVYGIMV